MKNKILYTGELYESLWATLGYLGPFFVVSMNYDKNSPFLRVHGIKSAIIFISMTLVNIPVILTQYRIIDIMQPFLGILKVIGFFISILLLIDYCISAVQSANGIYKKTFFIDKIFGKIINQYMINNFFQNDK